MGSVFGKIGQETPSYETISKEHDAFEVRSYGAQLVVTTDNAGYNSGGEVTLKIRHG
jgi:hypothetical protein